MELIKSLRDKYIVKNGEVKLKKPLKVKIMEEEVEVPEEGVWIAFFKSSDKRYIVRCNPTLTHAYLLHLKDLYNIKIKSYNWLKLPELPDLWGYLIVRSEKGTYADGEVHKSNLMKQMHGFACTLLKKRAEDRLIMLELGLYQQGLYAEDELKYIPEEQKVSNYNDLPKENYRERITKKIREINSFLNQNEEQLKEYIAGFTGQDHKNIDIDSISPDILAKVHKNLRSIAAKEWNLRKELVEKLIDKNKELEKNKSALLKKNSVKLEEILKSESA